MQMKKTNRRKHILITLTMEIIDEVSFCKLKFSFDI